MSTGWPSSLGKYELQVMLLWDRSAGPAEPPDFTTIREAYEDHLSVADLVERHQENLRWGLRPGAASDDQEAGLEAASCSLPGLDMDV